MLSNLIEAIGAFEGPIVHLLVIVGIAAIVDGIRLTGARVQPDASDPLGSRDRADVSAGEYPVPSTATSDEALPMQRGVQAYFG
jgi:hypothetical protein